MTTMFVLLLCTFIINIFFFSTPSLALDNGLGRTPAMGYNSWYDLECSPNMNEQSIYKVMDTYVSLGLMKLGYQYLNLDDCWAGGRDEGGTIHPDKKHFPNGLVPLIKHAHSLGLKFGLYTDRGVKTCGGRPGSAGYEALDAATYAGWGVDFLKEDSCYGSQHHHTAFKDYEKMRDALNQTGRPIFFDICGWEPWYAPKGHELGNEWRIGPDDTDWDNVLANINIDAELYMYSGPGGWNNPCLLLGNDINGNPLITEQQSRTQFSMWAILAAPLMLSQNIGNWTSFMIETYTNVEVIAVDQDSLGIQGRRIVGNNLNATATEHHNTTNIWARPLADGTHAMLFINVASKPHSITCDSSCFASIGYNDTSVSIAARDMYLRETIWTSSSGNLSFTASVPADGGSLMVKIYKV